MVLRAASVWSKSVCCGMVRLGPEGKIHTTLSERPKGWQEPHEPQPLFGHAAGDGRSAGSGRVELADRSVVELLADLHLVVGRAGGGQVGGLQGRGDLLDGPGEIDRGDVARDVVHHVGGLVGGSDDDAARVLAGGNLEHARGVGGIALHGRGAGVGIHLHLHQDVAGGADHVGLVGLVLEGHRPGLRDESLGRVGLRVHRGVHVDGLAGILAGGDIDHAEQALRVDVEADRTVGRSAGVRDVGELAADGDVVELVRIGAGDELEVGGNRRGRRRDALQGVAGGLEARCRRAG